VLVEDGVIAEVTSQARRDVPPTTCRVVNFWRRHTGAPVFIDHPHSRRRRARCGWEAGADTRWPPVERLLAAARRQQLFPPPPCDRACRRDTFRFDAIGGCDSKAAGKVVGWARLRARPMGIPP